jgi:hypothetical protein
MSPRARYNVQARRERLRASEVGHVEVWSDGVSQWSLHCHLEIAVGSGPHHLSLMPVLSLSRKC